MNESILTVNEQIVFLIKEGNYSNAAKLLLQLQLKEWEQLSNGYESLNMVKTNTLWFDGFKINIQYNAGRLISTSAKVDAKSIKNRSCFLCEKNLPAKQKGIKLLDNYLLLCNPYPVFPEHFTIVGEKHKQQEIFSSFNDFIIISKMISEDYTLIYNGPQCGASAPDHLHFQAGTKYFMPIENDFHSIKNEYGDLIFENNYLIITASDDGLRRFVSMECSDDKILMSAFNNFYGIYNKLNGNTAEPMMNLVCNYNEEYGWRVMIFLRSKHRSSHYLLEGENQIMLSPAAIDSGGVCIVPLEKDFAKIDKELLKNIFNEVALSKNIFDTLKVELKTFFNNNPLV